MTSVHILSGLNLVGETPQVFIQTSKQLQGTKERQTKLVKTVDRFPTNRRYLVSPRHQRLPHPQQCFCLFGCLPSFHHLTLKMPQPLEREKDILKNDKYEICHCTDFSFSGEETSCLLRSLSLCFHFSRSFLSSA